MSTHQERDQQDDKRHSHLAKVIVALIIGIPIVSAVAYGAVDALALGILFILAVLMFLLWTVDAFNSGKFEYSSDPIQLPLIGLVVIASIQLLPIAGADPTVPPLPVAAAQSLTVEP